MNSELSYFLSEKAKEAGLTFSAPRVGDAGFDIRCLNEVVINPNELALIETGLHLAVPVGWVALIRDRSSVALRGGAVTAGVIDASYRGEVKVAMHNLGKELITFNAGDKIAQTVIIQHHTGANLEQVSNLEDLGNTNRGSGGFGSTGK